MDQRRSNMQTRFTRPISVLVVGVLLTALSVTGLAQQKPATPTKNLYDRLGGVYAIASVVYAFIERLLVHYAEREPGHRCGEEGRAEGRP